MVAFLVPVLPILQEDLAPLSFSFVGVEYGNNLEAGPGTIGFDIDSAAQANDFWVTVDIISLGSGGSYVKGIPSGFTELHFRSNTPSGVQGLICGRILTSTDEAGDELDGSGATGGTTVHGRGMAFGFRPSGATISAFSGTFQSQASASNPTEQTVATAGIDHPYIAIAVYASRENAISPRTATPSMTELNSGSTSILYVKYAIKNPGDTATEWAIDMDDEGINLLMSGYVTFTYA